MWELADLTNGATFRKLTETRDELVALVRGQWPRAMVMDLPGGVARVYDDGREVAAAVWRADLALPPADESRAPEGDRDELSPQAGGLAGHPAEWPPA